MTRLSVTPATVATIKTAKPGDVVILTGDFPVQKFTGLTGVTFIAQAATLTGWVFTKCSGVSINGGQVLGGIGFIDCVDVGLHHVRLASGDTLGIAAGFQRCTAPSVIGCKFIGWNHCLTFAMCHDVLATDNDFSGFGSDGIDLGNVWGATVQRNSFHDPATRPGAHPDAIQGYSQSDQVPSSDWIITDNDARGQMQGVFLGDHIRPDGKGGTVDDGGFDRMEICRNTVEAAGRGVSVTACRVLKLHDNHVSTLPTSSLIANIYAERSTDVERGGNTVAGAPWLRKKGWAD